MWPWRPIWRLAVLLAVVRASCAFAEAPPVPPRKPPVPTAPARPIAGALPETFVKGAAIRDVDGLKIINTGEVDREGRVLLQVYACQWGIKPRGGALICEWEPDPEAWILGHTHVVPVYTGRIFTIKIQERNADGSVAALVTTRAADNVAAAKQTKSRGPLKNPSRTR